MRLWVLVSIVGMMFCVPGCSGKGRDPESRKDHATLQGTWKADSVQTNGDEADGFQGIEFTFAGNEVSQSFSSHVGTFELDASQNPKEIDFYGEFAGSPTHQLGLYELNGDELKLSLRDEGPRPTALESSPGTDFTFYIFKRVEP